MFKLFAAIAVFMTMSAGAAHAVESRQPTRATVSVAVSFADLDLATDTGVATLLRRVSRAADKACGGRPPAYAHLQERRAFRLCRAEAIGPAIAAVDPWRAPVQWAARAQPPTG